MMSPELSVMKINEMQQVNVIRYLFEEAEAAHAKLNLRPP